MAQQTKYEFNNVIGSTLVPLSKFGDKEWNSGNVSNKVRISFSTITKPSNFDSINKSHTSFLIFLYIILTLYMTVYKS
jgi:hypothetical protein